MDNYLLAFLSWNPEVHPVLGEEVVCATISQCGWQFDSLVFLGCFFLFPMLIKARGSSCQSARILMTTVTPAWVRMVREHSDDNCNPDMNENGQEYILITTVTPKWMRMVRAYSNNNHNPDMNKNQTPISHADSQPVALCALWRMLRPWPHFFRPAT